MKKISILGAGGLSGKELIKLLKNHPELEIVHITSDRASSKTLREFFRDLSINSELVFKKHSDPIPEDSLVALCIPNEVSLEITPRLVSEGRKVIDFSGAYRLHSKSLFERYYKLQHNSFELMEKVVFGIPEIFRDKIKNSSFVSNPGCYSTSVILPLYFLSGLRDKIDGPVIVNSSSGVSGAGGRTEDIAFSFTNTYENYRAYKVHLHQHHPEMEEYAWTGTSPQKIVFTPHLLPVYRGILSTFAIRFKKEISKEEIENEFQKFSNEKFVRFYSSPEEVEIQKVQGTNFLDIGFRISDNILIIVSALDNLVKGASGQALQNINLMLGFEESLGLI